MRYSHLTLLLPCLIPPIYLLLSFLTFHFALHTPHQLHRLFLLPFFLYFAITSFTTSKEFLPFLPTLTSLWSQAVLLNIVHITSLLYIEKWPSPPPAREGKTRLNFVQTWRLWGNPQLLHIEAKLKSSSDEKDKDSPSLPVFIFLHLAKLSLYYHTHTYLLPLLYTETIYSLDSVDLSPTNLPLTFPFTTTSEELTGRDILVRSYFAISWIWESLLYLDSTNTLLALFFVTINFDTPGDWPPLFGGLNQACGMRNFWGAFWHRVGRRAYGSYARLAVRKILGSGSRVEKPLIAFIIFLISGLSHAAVSWRIGAPFPEQSLLDIKWFLLNFCACTFETFVLSVVRSSAKRFGCKKELAEIEDSWFGWVVGYGWVFGVFWCIVPEWRGGGLREEVLVGERWVEILGKMRVLDY